MREEDRFPSITDQDCEGAVVLVNNVESTIGMDHGTLLSLTLDDTREMSNPVKYRTIQSIHGLVRAMVQDGFYLRSGARMEIPADLLAFERKANGDYPFRTRSEVHREERGE